MIDIAKYVYASIFLMLFLVGLPIAKADPVVLPIINQKDFQACVFGWCQTVAPPFLFTDINFTFANYSYISIYSNYTNTSNNSLYLNGFNSTYFYPYSNPYNFYNSTTLPIDDDSAYYLSSNPSGYISSWIPNTTSEMRNAVNNSGFYNISSQQCYYVNNATERSAFTSTYNSSYDVKITDNTSWNESHANALYAPINEPLWSANYSAFNSSWSSTYNSSYLTSETNWNNNYSSVARNNTIGTWNLTSNISNFAYNTFGLAWGNLTTFSLNNAWSGSLGLGNLSGGSVSSNWNMSFYNQSYYLSSESIPTCSKYYNSTGSLKWCDCFNSTHKWMANTC